MALNRHISLPPRDGKEWRRELVRRADAIFDELRLLLPSNYKSTVVGPNYTIKLKYLATEYARLFMEIDRAALDLSIDTAKSDMIYQLFGYLLRVDEQLSLNTFSDDDFRRFCKSLIALYFGGSRPDNIKKGIEIFTQAAVSIRANYLEARDPGSGLDIADQFGFRVEFEVTDDILANFEVTEERINTLLNVIKAAHELYQVKLVFKEEMPARENISATLSNQHFHWVGYEDLRKFFGGATGLQRLGVKQEQQVAGETPYILANGTILTRKGPLVKPGTYGRVPADTFDVTATVNGSPATVDTLNAVDGIITLDPPPTTSDTVLLGYSWFPRPTFEMTLDTDGMVLDETSRFEADIRIDGPTAPQPALWNHSFRGWDRKYTAGLDDELGLLLDEEIDSVATDGRPTEAGYILDRFEMAVSMDLATEDPDDFGVLLNQPTPLFEQTWEGTAPFGPFTAPSGWYTNVGVMTELVEGEGVGLSIADDSMTAMELGPSGLDPGFFTDPAWEGVSPEPQVGFFRFFSGTSFGGSTVGMHDLNKFPTAGSIPMLFTHKVTDIVGMEFVDDGPTGFGGVEAMPQIQDMGATATLEIPAGHGHPELFRLSNWTTQSPGVYGMTGSYFFHPTAVYNAKFFEPSMAGAHPAQVIVVGL